MTSMNLSDVRKIQLIDYGENVLPLLDEDFGSKEEYIKTLRYIRSDFVSKIDKFIFVLDGKN